MRNEQPYQAITALEKASQINPNRSDVWFMLAQAYRQTGQLNIALQCAEKACNLEPDSAQPLLLCGADRQGAYKVAFSWWGAFPDWFVG